jgi:hypothetical protein
MTTATLTPMDFSRMEKVGKRAFRKQILKKETITYKGQKIAFDDKMLAELAKNFNRGAYDQVPFQFADGANQHNEDPRNYSGELIKVELTADGLDGIFSLTPEGAKVVKRNPKLGVSARIMDMVQHADGRKFGRSIRHVLATMNPRITGMTPWQVVDLSEDEETEVVDLTAETNQGRTTMATKSKAKAKGRSVSVNTADGTTEIDLSELTDDEFQALLDLSVESGTVDDDEDEDEDVVDVTDDLDDDEDEEEEDEDDDESDDDEEDEDDETDLSAPPFLDDTTDATKPKKGKKGKVPPAFAKKAVKAKRRGKKSVVKPPVTADLSVLDRYAANEWEREKRNLIRDGVPPFILDLAAPLLSKHETAMVDLSNDESVDASKIVRDLVEGMKGIVDIKPELGHSVDLSLTDDDDHKSPATAFNEAWDKEYGTA